MFHCWLQEAEELKANIRAYEQHLVDDRQRVLNQQQRTRHLFNEQVRQQLLNCVLLMWHIPHSLLQCYWQLYLLHMCQAAVMASRSPQTCPAIQLDAATQKARDSDISSYLVVRFVKIASCWLQDLGPTLAAHGLRGNILLVATTSSCSSSSSSCQYHPHAPLPPSHVLYPLRLQVAEARERRRLQQEHEDRENALLRHELAEEQRREQAQKVNSHETRGGSPVHVGILCNAGVQLRQHQLEADGLHIRLSYTIEGMPPGLWH